MKDILYPRVRIKVDTVSLKLWTRKAWHHKQVGCPVLDGCDERGELQHNLGQAIAIPEWGRSVHRWAEKDLERIPRVGKVDHLRQEGLQSWLHAKRQGRVGKGSRDDVGDASDDACIRLLTN